ncbi:unnamed protein product [Boreogadus saida]
MPTKPNHPPKGKLPPPEEEDEEQNRKEEKRAVTRHLPGGVTQHLNFDPSPPLATLGFPGSKISSMGAVS